MKNLYISDMDGTLLKSDGQLSQYSKDKINQFKNRAIYFSLATARSIVSAEKLLDGVGFIAPIVLMNGVFIYDTKKKVAVKYHPFDETAFLKTVNAFKKFNFHPIMFLYGKDENMYIEMEEIDNDVMEWFYNTRSKMLGERFKKVDDLRNVPKDKYPVYISYFAPKDSLLELKEIISKIDGVSFAFYKDSYSDDWIIEVYSAKASKANGAKEVAQYMKAQKIIAFGDNLNDLLLLENADYAVAVKNAVADVKNMADEIIGTNDEDSVVNFIAKRENI